MAAPISHCEIWGSEARGQLYTDSFQMVVDYSARAAGGYVVSYDPKPWLEVLDDSQKARLTTWLIEQRKQGDTQPEVTAEAVVNAISRRPLFAHERADRLLEFIAKTVNPISGFMRISVDDCSEALARSESTEYEEIYFLLRYLDKNEWLETGTLGRNMFAGSASVDGYRRVAEIDTNAGHAQAFVAMWFDDSMIHALTHGFYPGIREAGYRPFVINRKEHSNKIEDEIEAEIRRSRFLVADFTYGRGGARGSVYYEAGLAKGLDMDVIFTCRKDKMKGLHFDTSHYNHIVWTDPDGLRKKLRTRILAVVGEGPEIERSPSR